MSTYIVNQHELCPAQQGAPVDGTWIVVQRRHTHPVATTPPSPSPLDLARIVGFVPQNGYEEPWDGISMVRTASTDTFNTKYNASKHQSQDGGNNGRRQDDHETVYKSSTQAVMGSRVEGDIPTSTEDRGEKRRSQRAKLRK
ncbi:Fc.00g092830.m01.CDS01 [Cosmosporella sp. VM-42]